MEEREMKTRKAFTRVVAMLLCVLSFTALLPTAAFAADVPELDAVGEAASKLTTGVKSNGVQTVYAGEWYWMKVPTSYTVCGRPVSVKFQWQVKKGSCRPYTNIKGANSYIYYFKATRGKNNWKYRCRVTARYVSARPLYYVFPTLKVRCW